MRCRRSLCRRFTRCPLAPEYLKLISSTALRQFAEVPRAESLRATAQRLFDAPSAVSRQGALLESELGTRLFERGRGNTPMRLTAAGELLMECVKNLENEVLRVRSSIEALKGLRKGQIRLGIPESFCHDFMPDFLVKFHSDYPDITFDVQVAGSPRLLAMLADDELDLTLTFSAIILPGLKLIYQRKLGTCVLVPIGHPLASRDSVRLRDCAEYPLTLPDASQGIKRLYDEMFAKTRIQPVTALTSNSYELIRTTAVAGSAVSLVSAPLGQWNPKNSTHKYMLLEDAKARPQSLSLCVREGRSLPLAVLAFMNELRAGLESLVSGDPYGLSKERPTRVRSKKRNVVSRY